MFNIFKKNHNQQITEQPSNADKSINKRISKLEEAGRRRGKIYLVVGISTSFLAAMIAIYVSNYILEDIISITGKSQENIASIPEKRNKEKKAVLLDEWKECLNNYDCAETQEDCCNCNSSGKQTAINMLYLDEWKKILREGCGNTACAARYVCQTGEAVCENSKCEFKKMEIDSQDYSKDNIPVDGELIHGHVLNNQDSDSDGLFDDEEVLYGCDINNPDTDGDGYLDGDEVKGGYNPAGEGKLLIF